ncbi:MAG: GNAT family N-acetyltransferase [Gammaproteobacteria bacterium]|nr:GNAT family N-acetyltransferase [Gammaproteobacteria bacterium]
MIHTLTLRKANLADAETVAEIYLVSRKAFVSFAPLIHSDASIHEWVCKTLIPGSDVIVAEQSSQIVGMMALSKQNGIGWVDQLYLAPPVTGQGIGTQLLAYAKRALGAPIRLHTFQENSGARRFYERHGFQVLELSDGSGNEERCPDILYEWN